MEQTGQGLRSTPLPYRKTSIKIPTLKHTTVKPRPKKRSRSLVNIKPTKSRQHTINHEYVDNPFYTYLVQNEEGDDAPSGHFGPWTKQADNPSQKLIFLKRAAEKLEEDKSAKEQNG